MISIRTIDFECGNCGHVTTFTERQHGDMLRCPRCQSPLSTSQRKEMQAFITKPTIREQVKDRSLSMGCLTDDPNRNGDRLTHSNLGETISPLGVVAECHHDFRRRGDRDIRFYDISLVHHEPGLNFQLRADQPTQVGMSVGVDPKTCYAIPFETVGKSPTSAPSKEQRAAQKRLVYMLIAETIAELGTCQRLKVGCVLLSMDGRVAAVGYNGAGPGMPHCDPDKCGPGKRCLRCSHAEENAVASMACEPHVAYVTHEPCNACTRKLIMAGVRHIIYRNPYTSMAEDEAAARQEWLNHYSVTMERFGG
jgi:dCMP deaminase